jgi:hypothetical protein
MGKCQSPSCVALATYGRKAQFCVDHKPKTGVYITDAPMWHNMCSQQCEFVVETEEGARRVCLAQAALGMGHPSCGIICAATPDAHGNTSSRSRPRRARAGSVWHRLRLVWCIHQAHVQIRRHPPGHVPARTRRDACVNEVPSGPGQFVQGPSWCEPAGRNRDPVLFA